MTVLWIFLIAAAIFYLFPKVAFFVIKEKSFRRAVEESEQLQKEIEDHTFIVRCHGGICDGHEHEVTMPERPSWYISPYMPMDEEGAPDEENRVGYFKNMHFFRPNYAYYQQMTDEDYFYVRDINENEFNKLVKDGELPDPKEPDDESD